MITYSTYTDIGYYKNGVPYNKFIELIKFVSKIAEKKGLKEYEMMQCLFWENGTLKDIETIYNDMAGDKVELYGRIIVQYMLYIEYDYKSAIEKNSSFRNYIEELLSKYCIDCIGYLENQNLILLYASKQVLKDNEKMILSNIKRINKIMEDCGIRHIYGGLVI